MGSQIYRKKNFSGVHEAKKEQRNFIAQPPGFIAYDPVYCHPLPEGHRFPMLKYELIPEQLIYEGSIDRSHLISPRICTDELILLTHEAAYLNKLKSQTLTAKEQRHIGFLQSPGLTLRELIITQGTIDCCMYAFSHGLGMNVAGGTHHAFADRGEGFCLLNDFAVAANFLLSRSFVKQILIVDLDVHQGNGTAKIFERNHSVFTFSMHGRHNYPFHKEKSDLDIPLEDGTGDELYISILQKVLPELIESLQPDFLFYLSGVDVLASDKFGKLKLSIGGCSLRDRLVFDLAKKHKIPCVTAMGGGYSEDIRIIVDAHCNTFRVGKEIFGIA